LDSPPAATLARRVYFGCWVFEPELLWFKPGAEFASRSPDGFSVLRPARRQSLPSEILKTTKRAIDVVWCTLPLEKVSEGAF